MAESQTAAASCSLDVGATPPSPDGVHGLQYPPGFLASLPVLHPPISSFYAPPPPTSSSEPNTPEELKKEAEAESAPPIRALNAAQWAALHDAHTTAHAPDGVLFPFLHGLEGPNAAQTAFFVPRGAAGVPRFRGLVWVASDEEDGARGAFEDSDEEEDEEDEELSSDEEVEEGRWREEVEVGVVGMDVDADAEPAEDEGAHMHPVSMRAQARPALSAIDTARVAKEPHHAHRLSNASSTSSESSGAPSPLLDTPAAETPLTPPDTDEEMHVEEEKARPLPERVLLTSTFAPRELLCIDRETGETRFVEPRVPDGISLRNFGIQVPIYATLSDIVVYSPRGNTQAALAVATHFAHAVAAKRAQRAALGHEGLLYYNVFVLAATPAEIAKEAPHVVVRTADEVVCPEGEVRVGAHQAHTNGTDARTEGETHVLDAPPAPPATQVLKANTISFAQREKDEMRELTQASEIYTVPLDGESDEDTAQFSAATPNDAWDTKRGQIFLGNAADARPATTTGEEWDPERRGFDVCIECDDMAPFPTAAHMRAVEEHVARLERRWMDRCLRAGASEPDDAPIPPRPAPPPHLVVHLPFPSSVAYAAHGVGPFVAWLQALLRPAETVTYGALRARERAEGAAARPVVRRSTNAAAFGYHQHPNTQFGPSSLPPPSAFGSSPFLAQSNTPYTRMRATSATALPAPAMPAGRTRPLKVLLHAADGYTESSALALCVLMCTRGLRLPEAYLALQNEKRRSFFVYPAEVAALRRVEARLTRERAAVSPSRSATEGEMSSSVPEKEGAGVLAGRRRANTVPVPVMPVEGNEVWFEDPRFDGSFPSRVLPFLYLGNLNHAANAYMLHALGITHVVSVGECALVPPERGCSAKPGSLYIEEREGRIQVLDIQGVCDDGIDSLAPQLPSVCAWIDAARAAGGKVLVHCRVGVSRSATVTIAYVMQHLNVPLVDAYLIVRSRRLSVLIQPNMRLLYNLLGWEVRLARERAGGDERRLREELARCLNWPVLAKEVHLLNEKYLRPPS